MSRAAFSSHPWSCYDVLLLKTVALQERGENVFLDEAARLDVIVVKGMMNWFIRQHRKLHFKWMKHKEDRRHDCECQMKDELKQ